MSVEGPKETNTTHLLSLENSKRWLAGVLKRLFVITPGSGSIQQPISRLIQPPPGLEDFAVRIQRGIDEHLMQQSQLELDRQNAEFARVAHKAAEKVKAAERLRELQEQEKARKEKATAEAAESIRDFLMAERLGYIQRTIWEGKGEIKPIETSVGEDGSGTLGGLELIYCFPSFSREEKGDPPNRIGRTYDWRYVPSIDNTRLSISVQRDSEGVSGVLRVTSDLKRSFGDQGTIIPIDSVDSRVLLDEALTRDTVDRVAKISLPSQKEKSAREGLITAKRSKGWMKWIHVSEPTPLTG